MKPSKQKGIDVIVFLLLLLVGCAKDTEAPVITDVLKEGNTITIEASDNQKIKGYILTSEMTTPNAKDADAWQVSNVFSNVVDGTYYVWVKDGADNISSTNYQVLVTYEYEQKFDIVRWANREIDSELKQKYGYAYAMVEPLTKEEIERRYEFLIWWGYEIYKYDNATITGLVYQGEKKKGDGMDLGGKAILDPIEHPGQLFFKQMYKLINEDKDPLLQKYKNYYFISWVTNEPTDTFNLVSDAGITWNYEDLDNYFGLSDETKDMVRFEFKEWIVRNYAAIQDTTIELWESLGMEPVYFFQLPGFVAR